MKYIITILFVFISLSLFAQKGNKDRYLTRDSTWTSNGVFTFNVAQTSFTNWAAGGDNQVNINSILHYRLRYSKTNTSWENIIEAQYGTLLFAKIRTKKTNDKLNFTSKFSYDASKKWKYSYYLSFRSQFTKGYKYPNDSVAVSNFMAPGYFMAGIGMDYYPIKELSILISPITYKVTVVNDDNLAADGNFGVKKAILDTAGNVIVAPNHFLSEPGAYIKLFYQKEFDSGLNISSRIGFFSSFAGKPENIDINWNTFISYRISRRFIITFSLDVVYDDDAIIKEDTNGDGIKEEVGPRTQVKQVAGIGLSLSL
ncbi:MAG: DUF3078 domain-containing protein [Bacteroidales bacterium]|nr:DUF3078 domain-containing protein [Bacteroidales bacterium]